jgi:hypothetical protein
MTHVDEFIYDNSTDKYASWCLLLFRLQAINHFKFSEFLKEYPLYCTFENKRYRVTGASRLGDIWLNEDSNQSIGYSKRVDVNACSDFSKE